MDNTSSATKQQSTEDALYYFFKTFLPARTGITTNEVTSTKFGLQYPVTDTNVDNDYTMYSWVSWTGTTTKTVTQYEDATYTTVPGDLLTDTTNSISLFSWVETDTSYATADFKMWYSTEEDSMFMLTQGPRLHCFWMKPHVDVYTPAAHVSTGPSVDRWDTFMFLMGANDTGRVCNLPYRTNTSTAEDTLYFHIPGRNYFSDQRLLVRGTPFRPATDYTTPTLGYLDRNDVRIYAPIESDRNSAAEAWFTATGDALADATNEIKLYRVNTTEYWAITANEDEEGGGLAFYMGTSQPDFT